MDHDDLVERLPRIGVRGLTEENKKRQGTEQTSASLPLVESYCVELT